MLKSSEMTGKLEGIEGINTNPLTNKYCIKRRKSKHPNSICKECYSCTMLKGMRKNCIPRFNENGKNLRNEIIPKVKLKEKYIRFNAHGELINENHLNNCIEIAKEHKNRVFVLWTKQIKMIYDYMKINAKNVPKNISFIYSNPIINHPMKLGKIKYFKKVFNTFTEENKNINCGSKKCKKCMLCYKKNNTKVINELVK